jgi:uncharacterized protein with PQ loop repeat
MQNIQIDISKCGFYTNLYTVNGTIINVTVNCKDDYEQLYEILGYIGGFGIVFTNMFQVIKVYKSQSTNDVSIKFLITALLSTIFLFAYGVFIYQMPLIVTNIIIGLELGIIITGKMFFENKCPCQKLIDPDTNLENVDLEEKDAEENVDVKEVITEEKDAEENVDVKEVIAEENVDVKEVIAK